MTAMKDFRKLQVWRKSHEFTLLIYKATARFPREERYALTTQVRRAVASIPANIAEGCGRRTDADFARFLQMAAGSASELDYHLLLASDLGFFTKDEHHFMSDRLNEIRKMLTAFFAKAIR